MFKKVLAITSLLGSTYSPTKPQPAGAPVADFYTSHELTTVESKYPERVAAYKVTIPTSTDGTQELEMHLRDEVQSDLSLRTKNESDRKESDTGSTTPQKTLSSHPSGSESSSAEKKDAAELTVEETEAELAAEVQEWIKQKKEESRKKIRLEEETFNMKLFESYEKVEREFIQRRYPFRLEEFLLARGPARESWYIDHYNFMLGEYAEEDLPDHWKLSLAIYKAEEDEEYKRKSIDLDYISELYHIIDAEEEARRVLETMVYKLRVLERLFPKDSKDGQ